MMKVLMVPIVCLTVVLAESGVRRQTPGGIEGVRLANGTSEGTGRLEVMSRGTWGTVCDDRFDRNAAKVACHSLGFTNTTGFVVSSTQFFGHVADATLILLDDVTCFGNETSLNECEHDLIGTHDCRHYEDTGIVCATSGLEGVRLVGGIANGTGRVEVMIRGFWGTVCNDNFDSNAATVVCHSLGFPSSSGFVVPSINYFGHAADETLILLDDVTCPRNASSLNGCEHRSLGEHNCNHDKDVGIVCALRGIEEVRLVGTTTAQAGRVEVMSQGVWGTVCDDHFDINAANVVCRYLGFLNNTGAVLYSSTFFGRGRREAPILLDDVTCLGNESSLNECQHRPIGSTDCAHHEDVAIGCTLGIESVRLVDGPVDRAGRLEVLSQGVWGTVCNDHFDDNAARVICRSLSFPNNTGHVVRSGVRVAGVGYVIRIMLDDVKCFGNESSLNGCVHKPIGDNNCDHTEDVAIVCGQMLAPTVTQVRLANGTNAQEGRIEVLVNGTWGTVCDDRFRVSSARVVCRMLGLPWIGAEVYGRAYFGEGTGPIHLDEVVCRGNETHLENCRFDTNRYCRHREDVGVRCGDGRGPRIDQVRLVNGSNAHEGRLEVFVNGTWGTVCNEGFRGTEARVVCRMLGFPVTGIASYVHGHFGNGTGPILLDNIRCVGYEDLLDHCHFDVYPDCRRSEDEGVRCGETF